MSRVFPNPVNSLQQKKSSVRSFRNCFGTSSSDIRYDSNQHKMATQAIKSRENKRKMKTIHSIEVGLENGIEGDGANLNHFTRSFSKENIYSNFPEGHFDGRFPVNYCTNYKSTDEERCPSTDLRSNLSNFKSLKIYDLTKQRNDFSESPSKNLHIKTSDTTSFRPYIKMSDETVPQVLTSSLNSINKKVRYHTTLNDNSFRSTQKFVSIGGCPPQKHKNTTKIVRPIPVKIVHRSEIKKSFTSPSSFYESPSDNEDENIMCASALNRSRRNSISNSCPSPFRPRAPIGGRSTNFNNLEVPANSLHISHDKRKEDILGKNGSKPFPGKENSSPLFSLHNPMDRRESHANLKVNGK